MTGTKLRARKIGHETRGYFLLLSILSPPPLNLSLSLFRSLSLPLPPPPSPLKCLRLHSRGIDIKQSTLWFGSIEFVAFLPPPPPPLSLLLPFLKETKRFDNSFMALFFLQPIPPNSYRIDEKCVY